MTSECCIRVSVCACEQSGLRSWLRWVEASTTLVTSYHRKNWKSSWKHTMWVWAFCCIIVPRQQLLKIKDFKNAKFDNLGGIRADHRNDMFKCGILHVNNFMLDFSIIDAFSGQFVRSSIAFVLNATTFIQLHEICYHIPYLLCVSVKQWQQSSVLFLVLSICGMSPNLCRTKIDYPSKTDVVY